MSFPRYASYRDSGVQWLGSIPSHWRQAPLKRLVRLRSGGTPSKANPEFWDGDVPWASSKDLKTDVLVDTEDHITHTALEADAAELVSAGSVLVVVRGMILAHTFPVAVAAVPMAINQDLKALTPSTAVDNEYLAWLLRGSSRETLARIDEAGHGTKVLRIEEWLSLDLPVPDIDEQRALSTFLRRQTAKVDALIAEQERLIELLKEKRQAVVSHAVTKGVNPDAPMKPSGIEWLGDVPAHWTISKMKWVAKLESGHTPDRKRPEYWDGDIPWVSLNDTAYLRDHDLIGDTAFSITDLGIENSSAHLLPAGTVVFSRDATIGRCAITTRPMAVSQHFIGWVCGEAIRPAFLLMRLRSMVQELERLSTGATIRTIGMPEVRTLITPVPPVHEQDMVVAAVHRELESLDALASDAHAAVNLLDERRMALISAAVTGQIDAREHSHTTAANA